MKLGDGVEQAIHCVALLAGLPDDGVLADQNDLAVCRCHPGGHISTSPAKFAPVSV